MKNWKKLTVISLIGLFLIALPVFVLAGNKDDLIIVGADEIIDGNFIRAGKTIDIKGAVNGDVIVAGSSITISGPVAGSVIAAGSSIRITGPVAGSVRVAGSLVDIDSEVEKNVWAAGSIVNLGANSTVGWDVYSAGANVELRGSIGGNVWAGTANLIITETVGKDVTASVDRDGQIILYPEARVAGNLTYKANSEDQLILQEGSIVSGEILKKAIPIPEKFDFNKIFSGLSLFIKLTVLFSLLVVGLVLIAMVPKILIQVKDEMVKRPGPSIGWGFIYLVVVPVVMVILMVTIIGIPLALIIMPFYLIGLYLAKVCASFAIGILTLDNLAKDKKYKGSLIWPLVVGIIIFAIVTSLPFVGWIAKIVLVLWALGAGIHVKKEILREYK
tara:strand:+ start:1061 stop:2224 length:1164 start_codon:yes stop_codon:yes gene_type:complete